MSYLAIAAGGTGGHILPGICIGRAFSAETGMAVKYFAGSREIESRIYTSENETPLRLRAGKGNRAVAATCDFATALRAFVRDRPAAVLAMGGAVCFPVLGAAVALGVPIFLHESNAIPGRVTRLFQRFAKKLFVGFDVYEGANVSRLGTPGKFAPPASDRTTIVCIGGSQGAESLNRIFVEAANAIGGEREWILVTGPGKHIEEPGVVECREYEADVPALLARASLLVSRAGSGTLSDIANHELPAILVPYPHAKDDHQRANAECFSSRGAAVLVNESELTADTLEVLIRKISGDDKYRESLVENLTAFSSKDAAAKIAAEIRDTLSLSRKLAERPHEA